MEGHYEQMLHGVAYTGGCNIAENIGPKRRQPKTINAYISQGEPAFLLGFIATHPILIIAGFPTEQA